MPGIKITESELRAIEIAHDELDAARARRVAHVGLAVRLVALPDGARMKSAATTAPPTEQEWRDFMGDDGTGHCRGCGAPLERIDPDCEVCYRALCAFMDEEVDSNGDPF